MKTPDKIKNALDICIGDDERCVNCSYIRYGDCRAALELDALKYIQQLERERDAAVEALRGWCEECAHWGSEDWILFCDGCTHNYPFEHETNFTDNWQWRGVP